MTELMAKLQKSQRTVSGSSYNTARAVINLIGIEGARSITVDKQVIKGHTVSYYRVGENTFYSHSVTEPALITRDNHIYYYLFDYCITQQEWFGLLGYTEDEQVAHVLKWGRHD